MMLGQHLSNQFSYDADSKTFTADASELGSYTFKQLYPDACDYGLEMVSCKTSAISTFVIVETHQDDDLDITHWTLKPTSETLRKHPQLEGVKVIVFND